jgi:DNA-binding NarL/FixJ family response regulator
VTGCSTAYNQVLRVGVAVHHCLLRQGMQRLLEDGGFDVVATDSTQAAALVREASPDVLLLGVRAPLAAVLDSLDEIQQQAPETKVLLVAEDMASPPPAGVVLAGARGVLARGTEPELMFRAIRAVARGEYWIERRSVFDVLDQVQQLLRGGTVDATPAETLTARERQIAVAVSAGESNREIAGRLGISEATVKHHVTAVYDKLGVSNRAELTAFALTHRLRATVRDDERAG